MANINFTKFPKELDGRGAAALGFNQYLTNFDNISGGRYNYSAGTEPLLAALDINWCGAELTDSSELGATENIETTEQLLTLINNMNKRIYALTAAVIALSNK